MPLIILGAYVIKDVNAKGKSLEIGIELSRYFH